jgi:hypothetical protein
MCLSDNPNVVQLNHLVKQLEHLGAIYNQSILALQSEVAYLNTALENALNNTGNILIRTIL